jgi:hypothetical protein
VDIEGKLRKLTIDQLYNTKFKKFLFYRWVQSSIICKYNLNSHKRGRFYPTPRNHSLLYTPITCTTTTTNQILVWNEFETFYVLIISSQQFESYALKTYPNLSYFLEN